MSGTRMHEAAERLTTAIGRPELEPPSPTDTIDDGYAKLFDILTATVQWINEQTAHSTGTPRK